MANDAITRIEIAGLRGFASTGSISLAVPDGRPGSGLTVVTGANSAGKSVVIEALRAMQHPGEDRSFPERTRNAGANSRVRIQLHYGAGQSQTLRTVPEGGSETEWKHEGSFTPAEILALPSRRAFNPSFGKEVLTRRSYAHATSGSGERPLSQDRFGGRLFQIQKNREAFNAVLGKVLSPLPNWYIEKGQAYFLRIEAGSGYHDSEGMGDGITSLFVIIDALYDSLPGAVIAIDEPELSLHPSLQRRLARLIAEYACDRQIIVATHSTYFVDPSLLAMGTQIRRLTTDGEQGTRVHELTKATGERVARLATDLNNPHTLGLDAREALFQEDGLLLLEGQEDVQLLSMVLEEAGVQMDLPPFGWGVGGADKMPVVAQMLHELGFEKVICLLDGNKSDVAESLRASFPRYCVACWPADDIRTKPARKLASVKGLLDESYKLRSEYRDSTIALLELARDYLSPQARTTMASTTKAETDSASA